MNCIECPILEECEAPKMTTFTVYSQGITIPARAEPLDKGECPFIACSRIIAAAKAEELAET